MTKSEIIARFDTKVRHLVCRLNPELVTKIYSSGRKYFIKTLVKEIPKNKIKIPTENQKIFWGIKFRLPLFNAAGMFKNGEGYYTIAAQGAGAYLAGTTTSGARRGNEMNGIMHPFIPYPLTGASSNWMGLPNEGHEIVAKKLSKIDKVDGCPVGASLSIDPAGGYLDNDYAMTGLIKGLDVYEKAGVDFIELNESCPNVPHQTNNELNSNDNNTVHLDSSLLERLEEISDKFLVKRKRILPVIVKLSNDTNIEQITALVDTLIDLKFDGVNFGNTSTDYSFFESRIHQSERTNYKYFISSYGGGLSGRILKEKSLRLGTLAGDYIRSKDLKTEFHVIRTGGIETIGDVIESNNHGISLNEWFTGYFENFAIRGHELYSKIFSNQVRFK